MTGVQTCALPICHDGKRTCQLLSDWGYDIFCFCDNRRYGEIVDGKKVISVEEVIQKYRDSIVVIGSSGYGQEMYIELVQKGFPCQNIVLPKHKMILAIRGIQYFDVFEPGPEEVYIDAGTFDGETLWDFHRWTNGKYKKIFALEPMGNMCEIIQKKMKERNIDNVEIFHNAAWNRQEELHFMEEGAGSHMDSRGGIMVKGTDIDSVVKDSKVTFIKMDIEGAEMKALEGARNTIIKNHPRLAICIYHKPLDMIEIAAYIMELVPEYKFYIRHYASNMWETVLYAAL